MVVHVRSHVLVGFANPYLVCDECRGKVLYWHDDVRCGKECDESFFNYPCGHKAGITSTCFSWGPVDGCTCKNKETHDK